MFKKVTGDAYDRSADIFGSGAAWDSCAVRPCKPSVGALALESGI